MEVGRINVTFDINTYKQIKLIAEKENISMSEVVRNWALEGLNGNLTKNNMDVLSPIIRTQLASILNPSIERLATLTAKTCVQAGTAAYLSAEALNKFVKPEDREDYYKAYEDARKKAVIYTKNRSDLE